MNILKYAIINIAETLLRFVPFPCKTGMIKIGNPDRNSPVFVTCNYHLTVERVKKALDGMDCYLLVANSRGINVWCGATGGHFTNHDVISVLKTSGIEKFVNHRDVIMPQLAAAGIEAKVVEKKAGWRVIWGPVYAKDIPAFVEKKIVKSPEMREVVFNFAQRIEMAVMWAFPLSIIIAPIVYLLWRSMLVPLIALIWALPILVFISFPFYSKWLNQEKKGMDFSKYTVIFDFGRIPMAMWGLFLLSIIIYSILADVFTWGFVFQWGFISFIVILMLSIDLMGSTPSYKSGLHEDRFLKVAIDDKKCKGVGFCEQVCPRNCYKVDKERHIATMPGAKRCVQCGACIIQCPLDALYFESPDGKVIPPEIIRRFKLNMLGKRLVEVDAK